MKRLISIFALIMTLCCAYAADREEEEISNALSEAEADYNLGRFDEAEQMLLENWNNFSNEEKPLVCRLMALCLIEKDDPKKAEIYAKEIFQYNPYFTPNPNDPQRFLDMISMHTTSSATIVSANRIAEKIEEIPVPTTIITGDMIKASGARTIGELLCLFAPGFTKVEGKEDNIAMHGIYDIYQNKILVLLNGTRLNSRAGNNEALDQRLSLEKIKHIEVLGGAASSFYGNVALSGIVNIVTKSGADVDGLELTVGYGKNNTIQGDILWGKKYTMGWASIYATQGETMDVKYGDKDYYGPPNGQSTIHLNNKFAVPTYDAGLTVKYKDIGITLTSRQSTKSAPYSFDADMNSHQYDLSQFGKINGVQPGSFHRSFNGVADYAFTRNKFVLNAKFHTAYETLVNYNPYPIPAQLEDGTFYDNWYYLTEENNGLTLGGNIMASFLYKIKGYDGSVICGMQDELFQMLNTYSLVSTMIDDTIYAQDAQLDKDYKDWRENSFSLFLQVKQKFLKYFTINAGVRYDRKRNKYDEDIIHNISPRLALIAKFKKLTLKYSYIKALADVPYIYMTDRYFSGNLNSNNYKSKKIPESMNSSQLSAHINNDKIGLRYGVNVFYNATKDLLYYDKHYITNADNLNIFGADANIALMRDRHFASATASWMMCTDYPTTDEGKYLNYNIPSKKGAIYNVPSFTCSLVYSWLALQSNKYGNLRLRCSSQITGPTYMLRPNKHNYSAEEYLKMINIWEYEYGKCDVIKASAKAITNAGIEYQFRKFTFSFDAYNIFNTRYYLGSYYDIPIPQEGVTFLGKIKYDI